jgi:hypothetical protein
MLHRPRPALLIAVLLLPLAACGGTQDFARNIGLVRDAPDEFTVTTRAPLSMPPDLSLPPPTPGASRPQELSARRAAEATIAPQAALAPATSAAVSTSPGTQAFLAETGPAAPADIRTEIDRAASKEKGSESLTDRLMFWKPKPPAGQAVDAAAEAQRIRSNQALGKPLDSGTTPIIKPAPSGGILNELFGI